MHWLVLKQAVLVTKLCHVSQAIWCNNLPVVSWIYKFRTNKLQIASNILLGLATRLHEQRYGLLAVDHISGLSNVLVDFASREHTTNPTEFLSTFTKKFPTSAEQLLNFVPFQQWAKITHIFDAATKAIDNGVMESTKRERLRFFCAWSRWLSIYFPTSQPHLQSIPYKNKKK